MTFMKMRQLPPRAGFGEQAKRAAGAAKAGQRRGPVVGEYASWWPKEIATWIAICPNQSWSYEQYNRDTRQVESFTDQYWLAYTEHRVVSTKRRFTCSGGAHKDKPCWGCGVRTAFYDRKRAEEQATGVESKKECGISQMSQYAMSCVVLETISKVQVMKDGRPRLNKEGKPIYNDTPIIYLPLNEQQKIKKQGNTNYGMSVHWSFGINALNELLAFDTALKNNCANCAGGLHAAHAGCPQCGNTVQVVEDENEPLTGEDLAHFRTQPMECECGYNDVWVPIVECAGCGNAEEGRLTAFALRIKSEKTADTKSKLVIVGIKPLEKVADGKPAVETLLMTPLNLTEIFRPADLGFQLKLIPDQMRGDGITPQPRAKEKAAAESYELTPPADEDITVDEDSVPY